MPVAPDLCGVALDGRYELLAVIGEGAFGRVYRGRDRRLDRAVAVKVIKPWWSEDPDWARGFEREARLLARCSDPGIVQIFDVGDGPEGPYYVSELVDGEDLARRLERGPLPPARARGIALGLCAGLAGAHALGIVHRDVKPANVLLDARGAVKVADFGVARLAEGTSGGHGPVAADAVVGTPRYMAPEQGRGGSVTAAADVYSVGAVLYEMLAGRPPFHERSPVALALAHLADPVPPLPDGVPARLRAVVARALAKDPDDRYPDAAAMARALGGPGTGGARAAGGAGTGGGAGAGDGAGAAGGSGCGTLRAPPRGPRTIVDPARRRRTAALLALALLLLAGLAVAAGLVGGGGGAARHRGARGRVAAEPVVPVEVPLVVDESAGDATARLRAEGLRAVAVPVPAPGIRPGTVTSEDPVAGHTAPRGSTVRLSVSEVPSWHTVTTFTARVSPPLTIRGERWRITVSASAARDCTLWVFCDATRVSVAAAGGRAALRRFDVGGASVETLHTGPGTYRVTVDPASGATRWSVRVADDY